MRRLVIIPAWNEQAAITDTLREIQDRALGLDILVVDDGSTDATAARAEELGVAVLSLPFNLGVGGAMRAGYEYARRYGYDQAIQVDADGQHDPADIERLLAGLDQADIVIGARFAGHGDYQVHGPRRWAMSWLAAIVSRLAHTRLTDITSGFRAGNRRAIEQYCRHYPAEYLGDTVDSLVGAIRSGLVVAQVPVGMRQRRAGQPSNSPVKAALYLGRALVALGLALTRRTRKVVQE